MTRVAAIALSLLALMPGCASATAHSESSSTLTVSAPSVAPTVLLKMPSPSTHPNYPPRNLADFAALGELGKGRRIVGNEGQGVGPCDVVWLKVHELDGTPPKQVAADLVQMAIKRKVVFSSCGGYIFGTTNLSFCNCYIGDHGYLQIDRAEHGPAPGKMLVTFSVTDTDTTSPADWQVTLDAPDEP